MRRRLSSLIYPLRSAALSSGNAAPSAGADVPEPAAFGRACLNLSLLIGWGILFSGWMLYFTDWFPVVGGLLSLGGLFTWIAFVGGLLTEERKNQFRRRFEERFLTRRGTWKLLTLLLLVSLSTAALSGSVMLLSYGDDRDRLVDIRPSGSASNSQLPPAPESQLLLSPRTVLTHPLLTGLHVRAFRIKVAGLPAATVEVGPLHRLPLAVPSFFTGRPVILVRPIAQVSINASPFSLYVARNGRVLAFIPPGRYHGEAVWVGCDAAVSPPPRLIDRWRFELQRENRPEALLQRWTAPVALAPEESFQVHDCIVAALLGPQVSLKVGDLFDLQQLQRQGAAYAGGHTEILPLAEAQSFAQELELSLSPLPAAQTPAPQVGSKASASTQTRPCP
jgi:hypothetical protein